MRYTIGAMMMLASGLVHAQTAPDPGPTKQFIEQIVDVEIARGPDDWRAAKLKLSTRRNQDLHIQADGKSLHGFIVWPGGSAKAPVVLMIPEDQGLNNWARLEADQIASLGYIVVVPDLVSGLGPNGGDRDSFPDLKSAMWAFSKLVKTDHSTMLNGELNAWADYGLALPQANGKLATIGFAWGGGRAFSFALQRHDLGAAIVFYDAAPKNADFSTLTAPVYGFYASTDTRVEKSLAATKAAMSAAGKPYSQVDYQGADHMFVRLADEARNDNPANVLAAHDSMAQVQRILARLQ